MNLSHSILNAAVLLAIVFVPEAKASFMNLIVTAGTASVSLSTNNWGGTVTSGQFQIEDIDPAASIFVTPPTAPGLTNTKVTCVDPSGCGAFQFSFTILGWDMADFPVYLILDGSYSPGGQIPADYLFSCTSTINCPLPNPAGSVLFGGTPAASTGPLQPSFTPGTVIAPGTSFGNLQIFWTFAPANGFGNGDSFSLPKSFIVQAAPEPSGIVLAVSGLAGLILFRRFRSGRH